MRRDGFSGRLVGVDYAESAIRAQRDRLGAADAGVELICADARRHIPGVDAESMDLVLDKGTVDAMISAPPPQGADAVARTCAEAARLLRGGGTLCVCSHHRLSADADADEWIAAVVDGLGAGGASWTLHVHQGQGPSVYLFTKMRASPRLGRARTPDAALVHVSVHEHDHGDAD